MTFRHYTFDDFLEVGGSHFTERSKSRNPFDPNNQARDPVDYYVPVPERGDRVKLPGAQVEGYIERDFQEFLDKFGYKWRTMSDIVRSALYHFHATVIATNSTYESLNRVKAEVRLRKLALDADEEKHDRELVARVRKVWEREDLSDYYRKQMIADLRMYARGIVDDERRERFLGEVEQVPGLERFLGEVEQVPGLEGVKAMPRGEDESVSEPETRVDPALEALAGGEDE